MFAGWFGKFASPGGGLAQINCARLDPKEGSNRMKPDRFSRRSLLLGTAGIAAGHVLHTRAAMGQDAGPSAREGATRNGYVLGPTEGEHLIQRGGNIFIKADPATGSHGLAMGTQQILTGVGIPIHRHFQMDEAFYVIGGGGTFILNDASHPIEQGSSIFIRRTPGTVFRTPTASSSSCGSSPRPDSRRFSAKSRRVPACRQSSETRTS
jgi:quercetin dioxygenase-like cupin family protein